MRLRALLLAVPLSTIVLAGCGADPDISADGSPAAVTAPAGVDISGADFADRSNQAAPEVDAIDNSFKTEFTEVRAGSKITFRNDGRNDHNVIPVVEGQFDPVETERFGPGAETTITFEDPGDYVYYCSLHGSVANGLKGMTGVIRVVDPE